jgi:hypothetical protein
MFDLSALSTYKKVDHLGGPGNNYSGGQHYGPYT